MNSDKNATSGDSLNQIGPALQNSLPELDILRAATLDNLQFLRTARAAGLQSEQERLADRLGDDDPRVINLLAPDAYQAMAVLVQNNRPRIDSAARANAVSRPGIAYVQFYGLQPGANFDAQSLVLVFRGRLLRPIAILPYSPNFNDGRLEPRQQVTAFYLFEEQIPVLEPFSLQYYQQYNTEWTSNRVANINTERQRALLRSSKGVTATVKDSVPAR